MIVLVHSRDTWMALGPGGASIANAMLPLAMGVDLFFLISGFLMVLTTREAMLGIRGARDFLARRFARIGPLFAIMSVLDLLVEHGWRALGQPSIVGVYLEGLLFMPHDPQASPLYFHMAMGVSWTLCFESYFYVMFAASMGLGRFRYAALMAWFASTLVLWPLWVGHFTLDPRAAFMGDVRYLALVNNPIVWDFMLGMLAGALYSMTWRPHAATVLLGVLVVLVWLALHWRALGLIDFHGPAGWGLPMAIIFLAVCMLDRHAHGAWPAFAIGLGDLSYALYLVHVPVFILVGDSIQAWSLENSPAAIMLLAIRPLLAIGIAVMVHRYLEKPVLLAMRRRLSVSS